MSEFETAPKDKTEEEHQSAANERALSDAELDALADEAERGYDVDAIEPILTTEAHNAVAQPQADESTNYWDDRPAFILSEIDNAPYGLLVVGWDTCGECHMHIRMCRCKSGPHQPSYVKNYRRVPPSAEADKPRATDLLTDAEKERLNRRKARVEADPQVVDKAVDEAINGPTSPPEDDLTPTGRKRRADFGKKRGPRKKGTVDSVQKAAGDLSKAMTDTE